MGQGCQAIGVRAVLLLAGGVWIMGAQAEADPHWKFTPTAFAIDGGERAVDLNLRYVHGPHTVWIAQYRQGDGLVQSRTGIEWRSGGEWLRTVASAQAATGGFTGASLTAELGGATYALVGWSRTNLRDYVNLNFDPNDAVTLGLGSRVWDGHEWVLFQVRDDRLPTQQKMSHLVWRHTPATGQRWTLDWSFKQGLTADSRWVSARGLSLTWDYNEQFVRLARDPCANFTAQGQWRVSAGWRF